MSKKLEEEKNELIDEKYLLEKFNESDENRRITFPELKRLDKMSRKLNLKEPKKAKELIEKLNEKIKEIESKIYKI